jgi:hypothetical protein
VSPANGPFEEQHGFSIDGVDLETAVLPNGWRDRLIKVQNANTAAISGEPQYTGDSGPGTEREGSPRAGEHGTHCAPRSTGGT